MHSSENRHAATEVQRHRTNVCTWLSTNMAMSMNMSCSSLILFSSLIISLCRVSISFIACWVMLSIMIWGGETEAQNSQCRKRRRRIRFSFFVFFVLLTPEVKIAGLSLSNMLSSSSFVVFLPAIRNNTQSDVSQESVVMAGWSLCQHTLLPLPADVFAPHPCLFSLTDLPYFINIPLFAPPT